MLLYISHHVHMHVTFGKNKGQCHTTRYCEHNYSKEILHKNIHHIHKCNFWKQRTNLLEYCMMTAVEEFKTQVNDQEMVHWLSGMKMSLAIFNVLRSLEKVPRFPSKSNAGGVTLFLVAFSRSILQYSSPIVEHYSAHCTEISK